MTLDPAVAAVRRCVRSALADVEPGSPVVVACSGGADSLALVAATVFEAKRAARSGAWRVVGVTVDHGLQEGSADQAAAVVAAMVGLGVDETASARVDVPSASGLGPEAAARLARYDVLAQLAAHFGASVVLLGHTRDDQAETVLLGLTRGSGGRSLAGMRRAYDVFRRPLLDVSRADTVAACRAEGIDFWADPHNDDPAFTRVRVRQRVMPVLEAELGPGVAVALARTADLLRSDMEYLDALADDALARVATNVGLSVPLVCELPDPIRTRVLRLAALRAGSPAADLFREHVLGMDLLVTGWRGQKGIDLPGGIRFVRRGDVLAFEGPPG